MNNIRNLAIFFLAISTVSFQANAVNLSVSVKSVTGEALQDLVVYAEPLKPLKLPKTDKKLVISQANKSFTPYISVTQVGSSLLFSNQDDITHHIYSASGQNKFAFTIRPGQEVEQAAVEQQNEIVMGCNVHDWMSGYLLVLNTPYFAKTSENGSAQLSIETEGEYQITVWHPQMTEVGHRLIKTVNLKGDTQVSLVLSKKMDEIPEQKNDDGFDFLSDY